MEALAMLKDTPPDIIGQRIRRARVKQGLSIRDLAARAEISKSSVVRVESGEPSHGRTIVKLCRALGLHLAGLLTPPPDDVPFVLHTRADDKWFDMHNYGDGPFPDNSVEHRQKLAAEGKLDVGILLLTNRLGGGMMLPVLGELYGPSEPRRHTGEEMVYVLENDLLLRIGDKEITIRPGEAITFWSAEEHSYSPAEPGKVTRFLSIRIDYVRSLQ